MTDTGTDAFEKRVGTTLKGKWTLERLLGVGGMAAVYAAVHKIGRRDAIKILHPEVARSKDLRARFEQEAHAVNRFKHPGAVEIRDIDVTEDGAPFLVMELLEGEPLGDRARRMNGVPLDELLRHVEELLDVLAAAHAQGIIHRDIKLDNLFVQHDGRLKVLDFGIARMRDGAPKALNTRTGATLGTLPYMPPEQVKGITIDPRADLFAVGATMYRLIAKRRIHEARTESELLVMMATQPAPPLASVAPGAPEGVCHVVDRALAFQRERRYPDATTMQADVQALRRGEPPAFAIARLAAGDAPTAMPPVGAPPGSGAAAVDGFRAEATVAASPVASVRATDATVAQGVGSPGPVAQGVGSPPSVAQPPIFMPPPGPAPGFAAPAMTVAGGAPISAVALGPPVPGFAAPAMTVAGGAPISAVSVGPVSPLAGLAAPSSPTPRKKDGPVAIAIVAVVALLFMSSGVVWWVLRRAGSDTAPIEVAAPAETATDSASGATAPPGAAAPPGATSDPKSTKPSARTNPQGAAATPARPPQTAGTPPPPAPAAPGAAPGATTVRPPSGGSPPSVPPAGAAPAAPATAAAPPQGAPPQGAPPSSPSKGKDKDKGKGKGKDKDKD